MASSGGASAQPDDVGVADRGEEDDVVAHQERERGEQRLPDRLLHEVGEEDDQRPAAEPGQRMGERAPVVALGQHGLEVEHRLRHATELVSP